MVSALKISPIDSIIHQAVTLTRAELLQLQDAIGGLVDATEPQVIDLAEAREERRGNSKPGPQGWFEIGYKKRGGKQYGPYKYLRYRSGGVKKSTYIGKVKP
jgi:hypothetical protein